MEENERATPAGTSMSTTPEPRTRSLAAMSPAAVNRSLPRLLICNAAPRLGAPTSMVAPVTRTKLPAAVDGVGELRILVVTPEPTVMMPLAPSPASCSVKATLALAPKVSAVETSSSPKAKKGDAAGIVRVTFPKTPNFGRLT